MLVVLAYRSEDVGTSPGLMSLRDSVDSSNRQTILVDLDRLDDTETGELAVSLLSVPPTAAALQRIAEESGGNPFLIHAITGWMNDHGGERALMHPFSLDEIVRSKFDRLSADGRHLLELVAVAGQPTAMAVLRTCGPMANVLAARDELLAARFARVRGAAEHEELDTYHDRIRSAVVGGFAPLTLVSRHRELACGLETASAEDSERIAVHFDQARQPASAATYALRAARRAVQALAFNKAARFFELALATGTLEFADRQIVHRELADALANAGRGQAAAEQYLAACRNAPRDQQLELEQLAAEQLLYSGHVDPGLRLFETLLKQVGMKLPKPASRVPLDLLVRRAKLWSRGLRWRERSIGSIPRELLLKLDTCAAVATGLALIDIARGAALQTTSLLLALEAGEPSRIARALAMEAGYRSTGGAKNEPEVDRLLKLAGALAERTGDSRAIGLTAVMTAGCAWNSGRWETCYRLAREAREALTDRHERVTWERDTASIFEVDGLRWMGRWSVMMNILPALLDDARARGDLYAQSILQMHGGSCAELANDNPRRARAGLAILDSWSNTGFHVEHLVETHNQVEIALYEGRGSEALDLLAARWPALKSSLLLRVQNFDIQMRSLRARAALAVAADERGGRRFRTHLDLARRESKAIARQNRAWGHALAELIRGAIASLTDTHDEAIAAFRRAETAATNAGMILHAAVARRSRGRLLGAEAGSELCASADSTMSAEGIAKPDRLAAVMCPGAGLDVRPM